MKQFSKFIILSTFLLTIPHVANAESRRAYFNQVGKNVTINGLTTAASAYCIITIANPSSQSQQFTLTVTAYSTGPGATGQTVATADGGNPDAATSSGYTLTVSNITMAAGATAKTYKFNYTSYSARPTITSSSQPIVCNGNILVSDPGASPGFLIAHGYLVTFVESGTIQTTGASGTVTFSGQAVFSQTPFPINRGAPF